MSTGTKVLTNALILLGKYNLSGRSNSVSLKYSSELQDGTVFGLDTKKNVGGLKVVDLGAAGFVDLDDTAGAEGTDYAVFPNVGVAGKVMTIAEDTADGSNAYAFLGNAGAYTVLSGSVGDLNKFDLTAAAGKGSPGVINRLGRGLVLANKLAGISAAGQGTAYQLGAVSAGKSNWVAVHVLSVGGGTLVISLTSDNAVGFPTPTTRVSFPGIVAAGSYGLSWDATVTTDDWWRAEWTYTPGTSATFLVSAGVQ